MQKFFRKSILLNAFLASLALVNISCKKDGPGEIPVVEPKINSFKVVAPVNETGTIDQTAKTITVDIQGGTDLTASKVEIEVPEGATVQPASGSTVDLTNPVEFTVTGNDASGNAVISKYTVTVISSASIAFVGKAATISELEDDAKAAATWMQATYGDDFIYLPASQINASALAKVKVIFYYELNADQAINLGSMGTTAVANTISNFVRDGGQLLLAGDAAQYIFNIDRVPASFAFTENAMGGIEENKAADDIWGLSVVAGTNSADRTTHPIFTGLLNEEKRLFLFNAPTREVRLVWWNTGPAGGECCGNVDMVTNFEQQLKAIKLGSLRHVNDYFGFAAIDFGRTDIDTHSSLNASVPKDFKGNVLVLANSIIGYEWEVNDGSTNDYHQNIEKLTQNAIEYLRSKYDSLQ